MSVLLKLLIPNPCFRINNPTTPFLNIILYLFLISLFHLFYLYLFYYDSLITLFNELLTLMISINDLDFKLK